MRTRSIASGLAALTLLAAALSCQNINVDTETLQPPVISNGEADFRYSVTPSRGRSVTITDPNGGASIYYTLNGSTPTSTISATNFLYTDPIILAGMEDATIVKARAYKPGLTASLVASQTFELAWKQMSATLSTARMGHGAVEVDGKIYIIGGFTDQSFGLMTADCEVYDVGTGVVSDLGYDLNSARAAFGIAVLNRKIYVIGGTVNGVPDPDPVLVPSASIEVFDTQNPGNWTTVTDELPVAIDNLCAAVSGGVIYIFPGDSGVGSLDTIYAYSPGSDPAAVTLSSGLYSDRTYFQAVPIGAGILLVGGSMSTKDVGSFDPSGPSISDLTDLTTSSYRFASAADLGNVYLFGGYVIGISAAVRKYSDSEGESQDFTMPAALDYPAAASSGGYVYVSGGLVSMSSPPVNTIYRFTP